MPSQMKMDPSWPARILPRIGSRHFDFTTIIQHAHNVLRCFCIGFLLAHAADAIAKVMA